MKTSNKALIVLGFWFSLIFGIFVIGMLGFWVIEIHELGKEHPLAYFVGAIGIAWVACAILAGQKE